MKTLNEKLQSLRHVLLDMDGTIYCGDRLFPTTLPFFEILKEQGITYSFLTNNSSKSVQDYCDKLEGMGVEFSRNMLYTSTLFAADYLKTNYPEIRNIFVFGTESMKLELQKAGFEIVTKNPDAVLLGYDVELNYKKLCSAAYWIKEGVPFFATHPDRICPSSQAAFIAIDCGCFIEMLEKVSGRKCTVLGKPCPDMLRYALRRFGLAPECAAMVGDRYDTDIMTGIGAGALTVHIAPQDQKHEPAPDITVSDLLVFGKIIEESKVAV